MHNMASDLEEIPFGEAVSEGHETGRWRAGETSIRTARRLAPLGLSHPTERTALTVFAELHEFSLISIASTAAISWLRDRLKP